MTVQLFRVGRIWHYRFQIDGTRVQRSTRESVKYLATQIADRAYAEARAWAHGIELTPTLRGLVRQWLDINAPRVSRAHAKTVEIFGRLHLYDLGDLTIDQLTTRRVENAMLQHIASHAPASVNQWLSILKLLCRWAVSRNMLPVVPWSIKLMKVQKRPRTILPINEAMRWLEALDRYAGDRLGVSLAVRLMFGLGLREAETITARWEWIDWERRTYTPGKTKGREAAAVPMPTWLIDDLLSHRQPRGLIVRNRRGDSFSPGFTRRAMQSANATCGVDGLTPHRLRGTFATLLSEAGVPIQTIQRVMRHKHPMTTMHYLEENFELAVRAQQEIAAKILAADGEGAKQSGEKTANTIPQTRMETKEHD